jgi:sulfotransferase family protein
LSIYEVTDVSLLPEREQSLLGFQVEAPEPGARHDVYTMHMIGWVVGRDSPALSVEIFHGEEFLRTVPVRGPRSDVAAALGVPPETDCVFHVLLGLIGLGPDVTLSLQVSLEDGSRIPVGSVRARRKPLRPDYEPRLNPLVVSTLGRSGSTWLMQMLASHPEIVIFRRFPYESAPAKYWLHMLRVASEPVNLSHSAEPKTAHTNLWWIGNNPYHDDRVYEQQTLAQWFGRDHIEHLAAFCQRTIDDWYMALARSQVQPQGIYFAEKHVWPNYLPVLTRELYPHAKELFLVRDFRDMALSILDFDARRGFAGFDRPEDASDEEYIRGAVSRMVRDLTASWTRRAEHAHLVRYEDLVSRPVEVLRGIADYLGVDSSAETVENALAKGSELVLNLPGSGYELSEIQAHRTVEDPKATIGRWRDRDESFRTLTQETFGEALRTFGYE